MKPALALILALVLTSCTPKTITPVKPAGPLMENPLYVERYAEELVRSVTELKIDQDPLLEDTAKSTFVDATIEQWLEEADKAEQLQREGRKGSFIGMSGYYAKGETLLLNGTLYIGPNFEIDPGPSLHVYLSTVVDPRDVEFPDATSIDLGSLKTPYGAHEYDVNMMEDPTQYRTVVMWDTALDRLWAFAQISSR